MTVYPMRARGRRERAAEPLLTVAARRGRAALSRVRPAVDRVRSAVLQAGALAAFTVAGWHVDVVLGLCVLGVSLLVWEWLSRPAGEE